MSLLFKVSILCVALWAAHTAPEATAVADDGPRILRNVVFARVGEHDLQLDLHKPAVASRPPLIVWVHGGAWRSGSKTDMPLTGLVDRGYAVASVDYRLSPVAKFPAQIHDIKAAIRYLRANAPRHGIDATRIAIAGSSAGGHLAALVGVTNGHSELEGKVGDSLDQSSDVQAIVDYYGPTNFMTILHQSTPHGLGVRVPALQLLLGGQPEEKPELAKLASPVFHVDAADPPLLLLHGDQDPQVPINQAHELHGRYMELKLPVQFEVIHGAVHGGRQFNDAQRITLVASFLEQHLRRGGAGDQDVNPAVSSRLHRIDAQTPQGLQDLFKHTGELLPLVSAHRGGAEAGFPENCIATFEHTLQHTFAILEIDPRYAKDGAIVVHHDATLERTTTGKGLVADFTLQELKQLRLKDTKGNITAFQIPTLDEVLEWARGKTVLVLDQKDVPVADRVKKVEEHKAEAYAMLIVYSFKDAQTCYAMNPSIMMEVMVPSREKFAEFEKTGIPWRNVVAFVGHTPPQDAMLYESIHGKGACCMVGSSRNLDRQFISQGGTDIKQLEQDYHAFLQQGADLIETDIPVHLGPLLYGAASAPPSKMRYFHIE